MVGIIKQRAGSVATPLIQAPLIHEDDIPALPPITARERLAYDYITHGAARVHPMTMYRRQLNDLEVRPIEVLSRIPAGLNTTVVTAGIVILRQAPPTARGMLFVTLEDETGFLQCAVPLHIRDRYHNELRNASLVVRGKLHAIGSWRSIMVEDVRVLNNVVGGYHGHLSYAGGRDTIELGANITAQPLVNIK
jgi:error-prone DNA polymerase